ncbi:lipoyl protein ligase domain-containing protein [Desulfosporosinus sp. SYSU MS00001]|uniref:lipoyl protein ligase domain-containing protein n=1 Tax=Desulfosporosinus sp. SYSU MS00001 TaxID=3416284 RepID=UPI003CEBBA90
MKRMGNPWRLLDTGAISAAQNMALDQVILDARSSNQVPNTVRFLQFSPPCALIGYHQAVELEVDENYCHEQGIEINRRLTGGGNLYWDESQLGWEIFAPKTTPGIPKRLEDMYRLMCEGVVSGLERLGVKAHFRPTNDIEVGGRKISGTGGTEMGDIFLYQGSLLTDFDADTMLKALKLPIKKLADKDVKSFKQRVTCLREVLGYLPPLADIKAALAAGISEVLGITLEPGGLMEIEQQRLEKELVHFQSEEWIRGTRIVSQANDLRMADYKSRGGLIRVSIRLDEKRQLIKSAFITGDFFAYPARSILDLEADLKNSSSNPLELAKRVNQFFASHKVRIPGVEAEDICQALYLACSREGDRNDVKAL